jgi:hypothetical protein
MFKKLHMTRKQVIGGIITLVVLFIVWFIYSHGYVVNSPKVENSKVTYYSIDKNLKRMSIDSGSTKERLSSGEYFVKRPGSIDGFSVQSVSVPHWLQTVELKQAENGYKTDTLSRNSLVNVASKDNKIISYINDTYRTADKTNITNEAGIEGTLANYLELISSVQIDKFRIGGIMETGNGYQPVIYNIDKGTTKTFPLMNDFSETGLVAVPDGFGYYDTEKNSISIYTESFAQEISLKSYDISHKLGKAMFSYANNKLAIVTGLNLISSGDDEPEDTDTTKQEVITLNTKTQKKLRKFSFGDTLISGVSLSPNGANISIQAPESTAIFSVEDGKRAVSIPYHTVESLWVTSEKIAINTNNDGILLSSVADKSTETIIPYSVIRPTKLSFADKDKLYFTGYNASIRGKANLDLYRSNLNEKISSKQDIANLKSFPHQANDYYIDILDDTITIQRTRYISGSNSSVSESALTSAKKYAKSVLGEDIKNHRYNLTYVDLDLTLQD